jgi:hypothetical protein
MTCIDAPDSRVGGSHDAELGGKNEPIATAFDEAAQQLFVGIGPVHVGGVEKVDA